MQFSERVGRISVSSTAAVMQEAERLRKSGVSVVDFGAGEPDFPTPENIKRAAVQALQENFTRYTATAGIRELKQAVVERHGRDFGSNYTVEECLVTVGGKQAIFEAIVATVNPGDEVVLPVPYWVSFLDIIRYAGGKAELLETREAEGFAVRAEAIEKLITPKTRMVVINSPNNPTGAVVPPEEMEKLLALAIRRKVLLLSDECYCYFLYDGRRPYSLGTSGNRENLIIVGSFSKTYAMTGWRLGFALGASKLIANMLKVQSHCTSNANSFAQKAAIEALCGPQDSVRTMLEEYQWRRDRIVRGLREIPGVRCTLPEGAFYSYPNLGAHLKKNGLSDATALSEKLLRDVQVAVVPGPAFGTSDHVRLSYATSRGQIEEGLRRLKQFFANL